MSYKRGHNFRGMWISFEAGEGAGKGTHIELLKEYFLKQGFYIEGGREPGHTLAGEEIRKILQHPEMPQLNPKTEMLLYIGAGIEFFSRSVKPVLEMGGIFIADRWRDSTDAYQGFGLGIDRNFIHEATKFSCDGSCPDLTFLIDIDAETGLRKLTGNEFKRRSCDSYYATDKIESRPLEYHKKVNMGYRQIARENPERIKVIPYLDSEVDTMQEQIRRYVNDFIELFKLREQLIRKG